MRPIENQITLQFKSLDDLWAFRIGELIHFIEMDHNECILTCRCSVQQIEMAVKKYKATVVLRSPIASINS